MRQDIKLPYYSITILVLILFGCIFADVLAADPSYMDKLAISKAPSANHLFGTDTLGRDLFSVIWHGGRVSLLVGFFATAISTAIALLYGCGAGLTFHRIDEVMMRFTEILMSIPQILLVLFFQAMLGEASLISMALVIGITGWMAVAKMARSEVRQLRNAEFVLAAKAMGGGFLYILSNHLLPSVMPVVLFMIVTNVGTAIALEATLSFLGLGFPVDTLSWGSLMSLSQRAILTGNWWTLLIPGAFLVITLICFTEIGEYFRRINRIDGGSL